MSLLAPDETKSECAEAQEEGEDAVHEAHRAAGFFVKTGTQRKPPGVGGVRGVT